MTVLFTIHQGGGPRIKLSDEKDSKSGFGHNEIESLPLWDFHSQVPQGNTYVVI